MTEAVLSTEARRLAYSEFIWRWMHSSNDEREMVMVLGGYYDESAVDGFGAVSVVGGLLLDHRGFSNLELEWPRALKRHQLGKDYLHMLDFGKHGELANFPLERKIPLMEDIARIITECKACSIGSTLTPENFKKSFGKLPPDERITIHGSCFLNAAIIQARVAESNKHPYDIPFMLDEGCPDRADIDNAHRFLRGKSEHIPGFPTRAGGMTWEDDKKFPQLQAADVIAWSIRRRASKTPFGPVYAPLERMLEGKYHFEFDFEDSLMTETIFEINSRR